MGRRRKTNKHLPQHMQMRGQTYYHVKTLGPNSQKWTNLGKDFSAAVIKAFELTGEGRTVQTIAEAIAIYLEDSRARLSPSTFVGYQKSARRLNKVFGHMDLAKLETNHIYRYMVELGNVSANRDRALLSATYTHMRNLGLHKGEDPTKAMHFRNKETPRTRYITDTELDALIRAANGRTKHLIRIAHLTGLRQGDMLSLRLPDACDDGLHVKASKTGKPIVIQWSDELRAEWKAAQGARIGNQLLFPSGTGKRYTGDGFRALWAAIKKRAGVDVRFQDIRGKSGTEHPDAQKLLQHGDAKTTKRHYKRLPESVKPVR